MRQFFNWLNKRFGTFDPLPQYFTAAGQQIQNVLWGALLPFLAWGIWFIVGTPPAWINLTVVFLAVFVAGYYVWRADHLRLEKAFEIKAVRFQTWRDDASGRYAFAYYLEIVNKSETTSIEEAEAQLEKIEPLVENFDWLPVHLRHKHDHSPHGEKLFTLHPGKIKHIDFVSAFEKDDSFTVLHIVGGVTNEVPAKERHRLRVILTGKDVPALSRWFEVCIDQDGFLQCDMEAMNQENSSQSQKNSMA
jgi:hypothetical protein